MARLQPLKLSDLRQGVDYPVGTKVQERRCLFHVKLTDFSMRSIESLINSDKGAFFSLWFAEGGGTISIPGSKEDRKFNFKTAQGDVDGLDCVHQVVDSGKHPSLNCWGQVRYKLQVQGTKEVYERTKKLMKETEEQKQKNRTQTINFPHKAGRSKSGGHPGRPLGGRPLGKTSSPFSTPTLSSSSHSSSSSSASSSTSVSASPAIGSNSITGSIGSNNTFSHKVSTPASVAAAAAAAAAAGNKSVSGRKSSKAPHTLKERIIHLLAVKPQKRADIINRLKKETKRGENAMSKIDSLLVEVADVQGDVYYLKQSLYSELRVDDWPFYSDAERQLVKRKHGSCDQNSESLKRPASAVREPPPPKRQKLSHPAASSTPPPPHPHTVTQDPDRLSPAPSKSSVTNPPPTSSAPQLSMPLLFGMDSSNSVNPSNIEIPSLAMTTVSSNSRVHTSVTQAQFPGSVATSFILSSSSSATAATTTLPVSGAPSFAVPTSQTSLVTGQTGFSRLSGDGGPAVNAGDGVSELGTGRLFGDLVTSNTESMEVDSAQKKREKKKKKKNKMKEKPPLTTSKVVPDNRSALVKEGAVVKSEEGRGGGDGLKVKSEEGRGGGDGLKVKSEEGRGVGGKLLKVKRESAAEENGASSTTPSTVDFSLKYPPITSEATRAEYKRIFNVEYQEYLGLKSQVEVVTNEVTALSEQMAAVKRGTEEAKVLKRKIRQKYTDLQQNKKYQEQKTRFQDLHVKLGHIKKLVVEYDQSH